MPTKTNYKGENFPNHDQLDLNDFSNVAETLKERISSPHLSFNVMDLLKASPSPNGIKALFQAKGYLPNQGQLYKGVYLFGEEMDGEIKPLYIGISQSIERRFRRHAKGKTKKTSSWAYLMAKYEGSLSEHNKYVKSFKIPHEEIPFQIAEKQAYIHNLKFAFVQIEDNFRLYMLEAYCSCYLKSYWNSFETH